MFDLPMETSAERKKYRKFLKFIREIGFIMMQKSVYVKLNINNSNLDSQKKLISANLPPNGLISILNITEKQFQTIDNLIGVSSTSTLNDDKRYIEL